MYYNLDLVVISLEKCFRARISLNLTKDTLHPLAIRSITPTAPTPLTTASTIISPESLVHLMQVPSLSLPISLFFSLSFFLSLLFQFGEKKVLGVQATFCFTTCRCSWVDTFCILCIVMDLLIMFLTFQFLAAINTRLLL